MTTRRIISLLSGAALVGLISLLAYGLLAAGGNGTLARDIADGKRPPLPLFNLPALWPPAGTQDPADTALLADGRVHSRELLGTPTLINFWASWCIPCAQEAPVLEQGALGSAGRVRFLGINVRDANGEARAFLRRYHTTFPNADDPSDVTWTRFQLTGVPESFLIDATGRIVYHANGPFTNASLEKALALLTDPDPSTQP